MNRILQKEEGLQCEEILFCEELPRRMNQSPGLPLSPTISSSKANDVGSLDEDENEHFTRFQYKLSILANFWCTLKTILHSKVFCFCLKQSNRVFTCIRDEIVFLLKEAKIWRLMLLMDAPVPWVDFCACPSVVHTSLHTGELLLRRSTQGRVHQT